MLLKKSENVFFSIWTIWTQSVKAYIIDQEIWSVSSYLNIKLKKKNLDFRWARRLKFLFFSQSLKFSNKLLSTLKFGLVMNYVKIKILGIKNKYLGRRVEHSKKYKMINSTRMFLTCNSRYDLQNSRSSFH